MVATPCASRRAQRGVALLGLLAVVVMVFAYVLTSRLNAASRFVGIDRDKNAQVLSQAKRALIGWLAVNATTDRNPGRLPCPEAVNAIGTSSEGISAPLVTPSTPNCATVGRLPWRTLGLNKLLDAASEPLWYAVSPGWALQVSTTLLSINPDSLGAMVIDGQLPPNEVVALIIAPGPAMNVVAAGGCTARAQARAVPAPAMNPLDYIECFNAATPAFSTTGPATSFNDQVVRVTIADLMPALEAAIADRAQREIAPAVRSGAFELDTNSPRRWVSTAPLPPANTLIYPYPVPFTLPTTALFDFRGAVGTNQGLMPFAPVAGIVTFAANPADVIKTTAAGTLKTKICGWESATVYACEGQYEEDADKTAPIALQMTATFTNVAMGFRARNTGALTAEARNDGATPGPWSTASISSTKVLQMNDGSAAGKPRGSVTAQLDVTVPNLQAMVWGKSGNYRLRMDSAVVADHPLLSTTGRALRFSGGSSAVNSGNTVTGATSGASGAVQVLVDSGSWAGGNAAGMFFFSSVSGTFVSGEALQVSGSTSATATGTDFDIGWFARNEWYRNVYYAVAAAKLPDTLPAVSDCVSTDENPATSNCLRYNNSGVRNTRVLLVIAGRKLATQTRPSSILANYLEYQNAANGTYYQQHRITGGKVVSGNTPWNDRLVIVDWKTPVPTFPIAYLP